MRKAIIFALILWAMQSFATTYYVSQSTGSDSNNSTQAQSKSTPWKDLPGSRTSAPTYTPVAGDTFVLMGCDVWPNNTFPITWTWSGGSGNRITVTRDVTWYNSTNCPSGWNRPVFDAGASVMGGVAECTGGLQNIFVTSSGSHLFWSWIEAKRLFWASTCNDAGVFNESAVAGDVIVDNWYIHDWTVNTSTASDLQGFIYIPGGTGACNSTAGTTNCTVQNTVFDNGDSPQAATNQSGGGVQSWNVVNSIFNHLVNAIKPYTNGEIGGNFITNNGHPFDSSHPNCIESIAATGSKTYWIHDNLISGNSVCEGLQVGNGGEIDYVWNNVWNSSGGGNNGPQVPQASPSNSFYFWNNTVGGGWGYCVGSAGHGTVFTNFYAQNNHCINSSAIVTDGSFTTGTVVINSNVAQTAATADANSSPHFDQYTSSQTYFWSPVASTNSTVGAGTTGAPSYAPSGASPSGGTFTTNDTTYACTESTVSGVVESVCPARTSNARPSASAWDAGAYEYTSTPSNPPAPALGLFAVSSNKSPSSMRDGTR